MPRSARNCRNLTRDACFALLTTWLRSSHSCAAFKPLPTPYRGGDARFLPLRVPRRFIEFVDLREQGIHKAAHLGVTVRSRAPVENRKQNTCRQRLDRLARRDQVGIFIAAEARGEVEILETFVVRVRQGTELEPVEGITRIAPYRTTNVSRISTSPRASAAMNIPT